MNEVDNYLDLMQAVILQAVEDYRLTLNCLQLNPQSRGLQADREEIETFFRSSWFSSLTNINGENLIIRLNVEVRL